MGSFYGSRHKGTRWISYDAGCPIDIPDVPCCYVVIVRGEAIYVGQTKHPFNRLVSHGVTCGWGSSTYVPWLDEHVPAKEVVLKCKFQHRLGDYAMLEIRMIDRLKPRFNCIGSTKPRRCK
jgi:hypothetical protein